MKKISLLIVSRGRPGLLHQCLASISAQIESPDQVVVVENDVFESYRNCVEGFGYSYVLESTGSIARARNTALQASQHEIIAFIDDDCVLHPQWVQVVKQSFRGHRDCGMVVGRSNVVPQLNSIAWTEQLFMDSWLSGFVNLAKQTELFSGMFFDTKNSAFDRSVLPEPLWFDEASTFKAEDSDFGIRLYKVLYQRGKRFFYIPQMKVLHHNNQTMIGFLRKRYLEGQEKFFLEKKYPHYEVFPNRTVSVLGKEWKFIARCISLVQQVGYWYQAVRTAVVN